MPRYLQTMSQEAVMMVSQKIKLFFFRIISVIAKLCFIRIPFGVSEILEIRIQQSLGKGWGAQSIYHEPRAALKLLKKFEISNQTYLVLDIGANSGEWTSGLISQKNLEVICFEPSKPSYESLVLKFKENKSVKIENLGIGLTEGTFDLWSNEIGSSLSSLNKRNLDYLGIDFKESEKVIVISLSKWIRENERIPDVIKLDIEGLELDALRGCGDFLGDIRIIQFEFGGCNIDSRTFFRDFWELLVPLGFSIYRLTNRGLYKIASYSETLETFTTTNYFAVNETLS
jgi:FkbM family methyltransferase